MENAVRKCAMMLLVVLVAAGVTWQAQAQEMDSTYGHVTVNEADLTWEPAAGLPDGAEVAVLEGNPSQEGPFTIRARLPEGYSIAPHWHPGIEHVTVLSGQFHLGMGETMDQESGQVLTAGGFAVMQPEMVHYAWTTGETTLQLHGMGPWDITYVNPDDDPRRPAP